MLVDITKLFPIIVIIVVFIFGAKLLERYYRRRDDVHRLAKLQAAEKLLRYRLIPCPLIVMEFRAKGQKSERILLWLFPTMSQKIQHKNEWE